MNDLIRLPVQSDRCRRP